MSEADEPVALLGYAVRQQTLDDPQLEPQWRSVGKARSNTIAIWASVTMRRITERHILASHGTDFVDCVRSVEKMLDSDSLAAKHAPLPR